MFDSSENNSWLARRMERALQTALTRTYETVRVHPEEYLMHLRMVHGVAPTHGAQQLSFFNGHYDSW